ncbi:hypothetical protein ACSQ67_025175 [Phaseolus vulgaris]
MYVMFSSNGYAFLKRVYLVSAKKSREVVFFVLHDACIDGDLSFPERVPKKRFNDMFVKNGVDLGFGAKGFSFHMDEPPDESVLYLILEAGIFKVEADDHDDEFVKVRGVQLVLNERPYYANGYNAYWLMYMASDPSRRNKVSSTFQVAANHGLSIGRTWAFGNGGDRLLQYSPDHTTRTCSWSVFISILQSLIFEFF